MRNISFLMVLGGLALVAGCTPAPAVQDSREVLWRQYGHQPVDKLLLAWGAPTQETHMTDGSRLVMYQRSTLYESQSGYEHSSMCQVSFIAKAPEFLVSDVAMEGSPIECQALAQGRVGTVRVPPVEPAYPYGYSYPHRYPFTYRY